LISPEEVVRGFEALLVRIDDLAIDNPKATEHLAAFLTRAVADDVLPPAFVASPPAEKLSTQKQLATLVLARAPLSASHFGERRRHVWGAAADGSLGDLKKAVGALCDEYLVSGEIGEAVRCVKELDAPSYHHEVVKRLVGASVVDGGPRELNLAVELTAKLAEADVLTTEQLSLGCTRLLDAVRHAHSTLSRSLAPDHKPAPTHPLCRVLQLPDLQLDHPHAGELLAQYFERCCGMGDLLPKSEWMPTADRLRSAA
jgi:hypothetical protein